MRILVVNPNTSEIVEDVIGRSARRAAGVGTEIVAMRSPGGTRNIDSAYGDYMSAPHMIEAVRRRVAEEPFDAMVLAGFGNVGIYALKEVLEIPVVSISEASMAMACLLGHRFSTLTMLDQFIPYQQDIVRLYGFEAKCASVRSINVNVERAVVERESTLADLSAQVKAVVAEDKAEVVILACAGLCDYDRDLSEVSGVPVIDPVVAGVKMAESFVSMGIAHSKVRKFHSPPQPIDDYEGWRLAGE
ncbi:MAG: hydantoin racemase [Rhodospirillaceae bacterium]|jgi:allantoin racemase|nr:hydantoin racemase [Rhodospirillaceae bacterium]MBT6138633.1 hydantoin racemase [Rhodospirillaceae bacterium]